MTTVSIEEAQVKLSELVAGLAPGDELAITRSGRVVARIVGEDQGAAKAPAATDEEGQPRSWPSKAGSGKTEGFWMAPDFDEPLEEFREYMG